jgi:DNA replication protein DnaC
LELLGENGVLAGLTQSILERNELLIIDEFGFAPLDSTGSQLLFRLAVAYERCSLAVASHWPFEELGRF